jgi:hypothetical protein
MEDIIKIAVREVTCESMKWTYLDQDSGPSQASEMTETVFGIVKEGSATRSYKLS